MSDWMYRNVVVTRHGPNTMGLRWIARPGLGYPIRTTTKREMLSALRELHRTGVLR